MKTKKLTSRPGRRTDMDALPGPMRAARKDRPQQRLHQRYSFGAALTEALEAQGETSARFAEKIGRHKSLVSKWRAGNWDAITPDTLHAILTHISSMPSVQLDVLCAYLSDMTPVQYRGMVVIRPAISRAPAVHLGRAAADLREKLQAIVDFAHQDADLRRAVDGIGAWALLLKARQQEETQARAKKSKAVRRGRK